jgi:hypothetical protein
LAGPNEASRRDRNHLVCANINMNRTPASSWTSWYCRRRRREHKARHEARTGKLDALIELGEAVLRGDIHSDIDGADKANILIQDYVTQVGVSRRRTKA